MHKHVHFLLLIGACSVENQELHLVGGGDVTFTIDKDGTPQTAVIPGATGDFLEDGFWDHCGGGAYVEWRLVNNSSIVGPYLIMCPDEVQTLFGAFDLPIDERADLWLDAGYGDTVRATIDDLESVGSVSARVVTTMPSLDPDVDWDHLVVGREFAQSTIEGTLEWTDYSDDDEHIELVFPITITLNLDLSTEVSTTTKEVVREGLIY